MFNIRDRKGSHTPRGTDGNPGGALHRQNHAGLRASPVVCADKYRRELWLIAFPFPYLLSLW